MRLTISRRKCEVRPGPGQHEGGISPGGITNHADTRTVSMVDETGVLDKRIQRGDCLLRPVRQNVSLTGDRVTGSISRMRRATTI